MSRLSTRLAWWFCVVAAAGGCGWANDDKGIFVNRSDDYVDVKEGKPLIMPPDLVGTQLPDPLPIPPVPERSKPEYYPGEPPRPNAIFANDSRDEVRIQRLGERRWLVVPESATTVWPKVRQFLADNGIDITGEQPGVGRINTEWLTITRNGTYRDVIREVIREDKDKARISGGRDRLLIRVEQGLRDTNSEVHLRYENDKSMSTDSNIVDLTDVRSAIPEVETSLLNELGAYIASKVSEQTISRVAQEISAGVKSEVVRNSSGDPVLILRLDYDRSWATIAQALSRAEVEVVDLDQDAGTYHVLIPDSLFTGEGSSWIGGLLFGGDDKYDLRLKMAQGANETYVVSVVDDAGEPVNRELSQEVLTMLREFAS